MSETHPKCSLETKRHRISKSGKHSVPEPEQEDDDDEGGEEEQQQNERRRRRSKSRSRSGGGKTRTASSKDPQVRLAIYVAMSHAGLVLSLALLFGLAKLLQGYWRPIQWAILCSVPLREVQRALVSFWSHPLNLGLFETFMAIPIAVLRATTGSLIDSQAALLRLFRNRSPPRRRNGKVGFFKLMEWLVSFGLFVIVHERIGLASVPAIAIPCFLVYVTGRGNLFTYGVARTLSSISSVRRGNRSFSNENRSMWSKISRYITSRMREKLKIIAAVGLITFMIIGSLFGLVLFSYKIGIEGKDAVISLKAHLEESNYAERIGLKRWMDENQVPELIDTYTEKFYATVSENIDSLASYYNVTEFVDGVRRFIIRPLRSPHGSSVPEEVRYGPLSEKLSLIQSGVWNREWKVIYRDIDGVFREFVSVIAWEDLMEKTKAFLLQSLDVSKQVLASGTMVLTGDSGGVMDHVLGMLPLSKSTRDRCAQVLDNAVSSVLLASAKVALFQGCFTYLLFRFYCIHFLYMSTFLAVMSSVLPITPAWLSSIPAAAQLAMEAKYIEAISLTAIHLILLDYGTTAIQDEIPGQNAYLTGLSILGGIALFPSVLEVISPPYCAVLCTSVIQTKYTNNFPYNLNWFIAYRKPHPLGVCLHFIPFFKEPSLALLLVYPKTNGHWNKVDD
ncbi:hypothetical protein CK203_011098 [Vitis vinifera]|uniref:Transmembrane protein 245 n=1 Tax=Vitis vinifera TaxID=29760 RepID=A0A438JIR1_VITVI|nr:hypothetical protein CK203_011098 [Vitis vinifera]